MEGGIAVSEQQPGLRFDIYERVHLPEEMSAIYELDEVELTPQIRVAVEGNQAVLKGCLLLVGAYSGQAEGEPRKTKTLEHRIPVEITLPINRVRSVDDIAVEIENFDIDLLSPRSLNVTGVLSLNGIEMAPGRPDVWQDEEEVMFVHEPTRLEEPAEVPDAAQPQQEQEQVLELEQEQEQDQEPEQELKLDRMEEQTGPEPEQEQEGPEPLSAPAIEKKLEMPEQHVSPKEEKPGETDVWMTGKLGSSAGAVSSGAESDKVRDELPDGNLEDYEALAQYDNESAPANEADNAPEAKEVSAAPEADVAEEAEKGEMKIAFGSKKPDSVQPFDVKSYLHKGDEQRRTAAFAESPPTAPKVRQSRLQSQRSEAAAPSPAPTAEPTAETAASDALEWKNLFLNANEEQQFRKVRLCIVHKNDTVESIAQKYDRKPQEIRLYNSLSDQEVTEGQVLYIP